LEKEPKMKKYLRFIPVVTVLVTMLVLFLPAQTASAVLDPCRGDPIFFLSNNTKLTIDVAMNTQESNVQRVTYTLHLPAGVSVNKVVYTSGGLGKKETYVVFQDNAANKYTTDTFVKTRVSGVNIVTTSSFSSTISGTAIGHENEHLIVELQLP
jgi:hypothetical protein